MTESPSPSHLTIAKPAIVEIVGPLDIDKLAAIFKKSAWRKWALACSISDEILSMERIPSEGLDKNNSFHYRIVVRAFHQPTARSSVGVAIASSIEKKNWAHVEHDVFSLCHTRAKNRAISDLTGGGEVSAEEMEPNLAPSRPSPQAQVLQFKP